MQVTASIYDKRIDCGAGITKYKGFYHATFAAEYHIDIPHPDCPPPSIIIDKIELWAVDFSEDKTEKRTQYLGEFIPREMKEFILAHTDFSTVKEKIFDKASRFPSRS